MARTRLKILVADDDPEDLELMEENILSVEPTVQLDKFVDGRSAFEYLRSSPDEELPSLIILDYNMPGLSGCQVLSYLKNVSRYRSIPKIVLSGANAERFIDECLNNGATEYIVKPDSIKEIHNLARKLVLLAAKAL